MSVQTQSVVVESLIKSIDIPDSAYEKANNRYKGLSEWFGSDKALSSQYDPHIYSQGSFRLGTVVKPVEQDGAYDLDVGCRLRQGITKATHSQAKLKQIVGEDLEAYRRARGILEELEEKNRCWCLLYADDLKFHMDVVPSIPEDETGRSILSKSMNRGGRDEASADSIAEYTGAITDRRHPEFERICLNWHVSNSEGYAQWFEERMRSAGWLQRMLEKAVKVDALPLYKRRSPLQQCVQILKRHRDVMFADRSELKPISVILTTLAANSYNGEEDVTVAVQNVLARMDNYVNDQHPRVPNPVNPAEDFADKWLLDDRLEKGFWEWLEQARSDLRYFQLTHDTSQIIEKAVTRFGVNLNEGDLRERLGVLSSTGIGGMAGLARTAPTRAVDHRGGGKFG